MRAETSESEKAHSPSYIFGTVSTLIALLDGSEQRLVIPFDPDEVSDHMARVRLVSDPADGESYVFELMGGTEVVPGAAVEMNTTAIEFGTTLINQVDEERITVSSTGSQVLEIIAVRRRGHDASAFSFSGIGIPYKIPPGESVDIRIHFPPIKEGNHSAFMEIVTNAENYTRRTIVLTGTGELVISGDGEPVEGDDMFTLTPNPVRAGSGVQYQYHGTTPVTCDITMFDAYGREIYSLYGQDIQPCGQNYLPPTGSLQRGTYYLRFRMPHMQRTIPLVVTKRRVL